MSNPSHCRVVVSTVGLVLACASLCFPIGENLPATHSPASPFGFQRLVIVHLLAAWPLAYLVAEWLAPRRFRGRALVGAVSIVLAFLATAFIHVAGPDGMDAARLPPLDFAGGWLAREVTAGALALLWNVSAWWMFPNAANEGESHQRFRWQSALIAAIAMLVVPATFADYLFRRETAALEAHWRAGRLWRLPDSARRLEAAGSPHWIGDRSIAGFREGIELQLSAFRGYAREPLAPNAPTTLIVRRAALLAALGELDAARGLLLPHADRDAQAALVLAQLDGDQSRHDEAARRFRRAIALARGDSATSGGQTATLAYEGLASTLRDLHRFKEAEQVYREAMRVLPESEAHFQFQLGRHYALGGRPRDALAAFSRAAELDPGRYGLDRPDVQAQLRPLREGTPECLLPRLEWSAPAMAR